MTSRPIIVTSSPEWNTRCAASGSAQMLNSAAGVMFPSAIAPPMRTIRCRPDAAVERQRDVRQRPDGHEHGLGRHVLDEEVDGALLDRLGGARRQLGAVEAALAVDVGGDVELAHERPLGTDGDRHVGAVDEREQPEGVVRRLVERLVAVRRRDADELELRAREREQERDRVVVPGVAVEDDRRRHRRSMASTSSSRRQGRLRAEARGGERSRGAGAAQRRPPAPDPAASETSRQAVNASPAAVPSTASTGGGSARAISSPSSSRIAPSAPSVTATRPSRRRSTSSS